MFSHIVTMFLIYSPCSLIYSPSFLVYSLRVIPATKPCIIVQSTQSYSDGGNNNVFYSDMDYVQVNICVVRSIFRSDVGLKLGICAM